MSRKYFSCYLMLAIVLLSPVVIYLWQKPRYSYQWVYSGIGSLSISSDGKHVVSSHLGGIGSLWDIPAHLKITVAEHVNIHSAFFVPGQSAYMFQDANNHSVSVKSLEGEIIKSFNPGFDTYGQVIDSRLLNYLASDKQWQLHLFRDLRNDNIIKPYDNGPGIDSSGKLLDLSIAKGLVASSGIGDGDDNITINDGSNDIIAGLTKNTHISRSLWAGVMVWDILTGKPIARMSGMVYKTHATISPDGGYVVAGDENGHAFVWVASTGKRVHRLDDMWLGRWLGGKKINGHYFDSSKVEAPPKDFCKRYDSKQCSSSSRVNAIRFIDETHFLRFTEGVPYAILYDVLNPRPLKYFHLGKDVNPDTYGYTVSHRIATAPKAGILVMAQGRDNDINKGSGILVYQYDKKKQTLKRIWAPEGPKAHRVKRKRV